MSTSSELPSAETLVAELLSRKNSAELKPAKSPAPPVVEQPPVATVIAEPAPEPEIPVAVAPKVAPSEPSGPGQDLDLPSKIEFPESNFDRDDLTLPEGLLDEPATSSASAPAPPVQRQSATLPKVAPQASERQTLVDRIRAQARLSILLPAVICLAIGMPVVSWLGWAPWTQHVSTPPHAAAGAPSIPAAIPKAPPRAAVSAPSNAGVVEPRPATSAPPKAAVVEPRATEHVPTAPESKQPPAAAPKAPAALVSKDVSKVPPAAAAPVVTPKPALQKGFSVQVAAVHARDEADRIAAKLVQQGYSGYVVIGDGAAADYYRVRIGAFQDRQAAEDVARKIESTEGIKPWIVKESR